MAPKVSNAAVRCVLDGAKDPAELCNGLVEEDGPRFLGKFGFQGFAVTKEADDLRGHPSSAQGNWRWVAAKGSTHKLES